MWAPLVEMAFEGLVRYGFEEDAVRIGQKYLKTVENIFKKHGAITEKFNPVTGEDDIKVAFGYDENVPGFGWSNGVAERLQKRIMQLTPKPDLGADFEQDDGLDRGPEPEPEPEAP